jgi:hypothetical protein
MASTLTGVTEDTDEQLDAAMRKSIAEVSEWRRNMHDELEAQKGPLPLPPGYHDAPHAVSTGHRRLRAIRLRRPSGRQRHRCKPGTPSAALFSCLLRVNVITKILSVYLYVGIYITTVIRYYLPVP